MKPYESIQNLWTVYPDGTHAQLAYGDHYAFSEGPRTFFEARQIPGTSKVLCIGAGHHNTGVGPLLMVDLNKNRGGKDGFVNLTPEVPFPETGYNEDILSDGGWYASPYPLSEDFYIVCYSFERDEANQSGYGLYLLDRFGNKELIYRDAAMSCYAPIPIAPRKRPPVIPDSTVGRDPNMPGKMVLANVYEGLPGVKNGTVKYLRVLESLRKPMHTTPFNVDTGKECGLDPRVVLGTVPVEPDGSAYFTIPQDRPVFFEALDKDFLEIRRMRSFVSTRPGETISCLGCHEPYSRVASRKMPTATSRPPSEIAPPPWGKGVGMDFRQLVQPLLNRRCISCHDGSTGSARSFDLRGNTLDEVRAGNGKHYANPMQSYTKLLQYVNYIHLRAYDDGVYNEGNLPLKPYAIGSGVSKLMQLLKNSHRGVTLSEDEWQLLAAWIDCNAPFYGEWDDICFRGERTVRERKAELEKQSPGGYGLAAYVNGGVRHLDQVAGGPAMLIEGGSRYAYYVGNEPAASHYAVVLRSPKVLNVQLGSMGPQQGLQVGLELVGL